MRNTKYKLFKEQSERQGIKLLRWAFCKWETDQEVEGAEGKKY